MKATSEEDIKFHLDMALIGNGILVCTLKEGLTETAHIHSKNPVLYTQIEFQPQFYFEGFYSGLMFYPHGKCQGLMDFDVRSFESIAYLQEA